MRTRFLVIILLAAILSACGDAADFRKKIINSDNGEPLILFASGTYEVAASFMNIGDLLDDGVGFCVSGDALFVAPPAPVPDEVVQISFTDCVDENGITYNGAVSMKITAYTDWENLEYSLLFDGLSATSDWFGGKAMVVGSLDYVVAGEAGTVDLPFDTLTTEVSTGMMGQLQLDALNLTVELDEDNPDVTKTSVDGSGELSNTDFSGPVTLKTSSVLSIDTANVDLLCPQTGALRLTATEDSSYASLEYPSGTNNVYQVRTNGSFIEQYDCI
ncbi:MAG: hypothetical protein P8Y83_01795 [Gammaproteobacteria bacterium]